MYCILLLNLLLRSISLLRISHPLISLGLPLPVILYLLKLGQHHSSSTTTDSNSLRRRHGCSSSIGQVHSSSIHPLLPPSLFSLHGFLDGLASAPGEAQGQSLNHHPPTYLHSLGDFVIRDSNIVCIITYEVHVPRKECVESMHVFACDTLISFSGCCGLCHRAKHTFPKGRPKTGRCGWRISVQPLLLPLLRCHRWCCGDRVLDAQVWHGTAHTQYAESMAWCCTLHAKGASMAWRYTLHAIAKSMACRCTLHGISRVEGVSFRRAPEVSHVHLNVSYLRTSMMKDGEQFVVFCCWVPRASL